MPQVLVTERIDNFEHRSYAAGTVVTINDADAVTWLKSRRQVDDTPALVAAAIAGGAVPVVHATGFAPNRRAAQIITDVDTGRPRLESASMAALYATTPGLMSNRTAVFGDSITVFGTNVEGGNQIANSSVVTARNLIRKALAQIGNPARLVAERGVGGNTLAQIRTRMEAELPALRVGRCILQGGSNSLDGGVTADAAFADVLAMYRLCRSMGVRFLYIFTTAMQRNQGASRNEFARLRAFCRQAMIDLPDFVYCEVAVAGQAYGGTVDQTSYGATLTVPAATVDADTTHPTAYACTVESIPLAATLKWWYGVDQWNRAGINANAGGNSYDESNLMVNSLFAGAGVAAGAGCTGLAPNGMDLTRSGGITAEGSFVARDDRGPGRWWQLDISGATAVTDYVRAGCGYAAPNGNIALTPALVGLNATIQLEIDASVTSGYITGLRTVARLKTSGGAILGTVIVGEPFRAAELDYITSFKGILQSREFVVPVGAQVMDYYLYVYTSVGAVVRVRLTGMEARADTYSPVLQ